MIQKYCNYIASWISNHVKNDWSMGFHVVKLAYWCHKTTQVWTIDICCLLMICSQNFPVLIQLIFVMNIYFWIELMYLLTTYCELLRIYITSFSWSNVGVLKMWLSLRIAQRYSVTFNNMLHEHYYTHECQGIHSYIVHVEMNINSNNDVWYLANCTIFVNALL